MGASEKDPRAFDEDDLARSLEVFLVGVEAGQSGEEVEYPYADDFRRHFWLDGYEYGRNNPEKDSLE